MGCLGFRGLLLTDCAFGRFYGRNNINNFTRFVVYNLFTRCIIANIKTPGINLILLDITGHGTIYISHFIIPMISGIDHQRRLGRKFPHFLAVNLIINRSIIIKHADADVCTDFHCCQAWKSDEAMREDWGEAYPEKLSRIRDAVESTAGEYLQFAGQAAFTAFHSSSAGFTEACGAIWSELPYLVSVSSPEDSSSVPNYVSSFSISAPELCDTLRLLHPEANFSAPPEEWIGEITRDESGRVSALTIGGAAFTGVKLRELFALRSTAFTLDYADGNFTFTVIGFGHGVGMSQYGANVMASDGADYRTILAHYYPGTELVSL